jgi:hypothetical protein
MEKLTDKSIEHGSKILQALVQDFDTMMAGTFLYSIVKFLANDLLRKA